MAQQTYGDPTNTTLDSMGTGGTGRLFSYLMAHPLTASTGPVSSMGEGAARVGSGALGGMNNMLMAQLMAQQKKVAPKYNSIDDLMGAKGLFGMGDMSFPEFAPGP